MASDQLPAVTGSDAFLSFVERAMRDPTFDVAKFQMLLSEARLERDRDRRELFNRDMAEVQSEIRQIAARGKNPTFNNPYAKLEDLDREARPVYSAHGFSVRYGSALSDRSVPAPRDGEIRMVLVISHRGGYSEEHYLDGPKDTQSGPKGRTAIQAVGSTVTYLRRYLLQMVLNLVSTNDPADDDGEAQRQRAAPPPRQPNGPTVEERLAKLKELLDACENTDAIEDLRKRSARVIADAPAAIRARIEAMFDDARQNVAAKGDPVLGELMHQVDMMSLDEIEALPQSAAWRRQLDRLFPPDLPQLEAHIQLRRRQLTGEESDG